MMPLLSIKNLRAAIEGKTILRGISLAMRQAELHVIMGPNGSGKSTLAYALLGHPGYAISGSILFRGKNISSLPTDERARRGLFLGFQYPLTVSGLSLETLMPAALKARGGKKKIGSGKKYDVTLASKMARQKNESLISLRATLEKHLATLRMSEDMLHRSLNEGFSGGEKKKAELLQMLALQPALAILDEPDSGLDIDALQSTARAITIAQKAGTAILLITHYQRILKYLKPDAVHVLIRGKIVETGSADLARRIEKTGYEKMQKK